ncbi:MAG TPA: hypothetical protein VMV73_03580 [Candidatus Dormibacteraeota bacterium]|nr:hypothetical protein [Candidatus Dormibacteraeota bacterium]
MKKLLFAFVPAFAVLASLQAASASTTQVGLSTILVTGQHRESSATATLSAPAPVLWISHRSGRFTLFAEATASLGSDTVLGNKLGLTSVQLSYMNALVRYHLTPNTSVGLGESVYNQQSDYTRGTYRGASFGEIDTSRVVGVRYQVRELIYRTAHSKIVARFAFNPHLWAHLDIRNTDGDGDGGDGRFGEGGFMLPEHGSQIDAALESSTRNRRFTFTYGVRYVNLVMLFPYGELADQNSFVIPFVGLSTAVGR